MRSNAVMPMKADVRTAMGQRTLKPLMTGARVFMDPARTGSRRKRASASSASVGSTTDVPAAAVLDTEALDVEKGWKSEKTSAMGTDAASPRESMREAECGSVAVDGDIDGRRSRRDELSRRYPATRV